MNFIACTICALVSGIGASLYTGRFSMFIAVYFALVSNYYARREPQP